MDCQYRDTGRFRNTSNETANTGIGVEPKQHIQSEFVCLNGFNVRQHNKAI
jgi:hypothetical protein